jgi:hypothetical protein
MVPPEAAAGQSSTSFESHAEQVVLRLRTALGAIIDGLPGSVRRPHELQKALGIDKNLAWRIVRVVEAKDAFELGRHIPGRSAMRSFLNAAADCVDETLIEAAQKADEGFERLIELHAGDRASMLMMMAGCARRGREQVDVAHRKAAFQGMSYIWGVQASAQLKTDIVHPSAEHRGFLDIASLRGFIGLRRMRPNVPWVIARGRSSDDDGVVRSPMVREPIDTCSGSDQVPLLRRFCSQPLPQFRRIVCEHGFVDDELVEGPIGNMGAVTCVTGEVVRNLGSYYRDEHNRWGTVNARLHTPCEVLVFDQFVHEDMFGRIQPKVGLHSDLSGRMWIPVVARERDRLAVQVTAEYLGKGPSVAYTPHVPRYSEMLRYVFGKLGWDGERCDVYRVVMKYPVVPSTIAMTHELPEAPA